MPTSTTIKRCRITGAPIDPRWLALVPHATVAIDFDRYMDIRRAIGLPITEAMLVAEQSA